MSLTCRVDSHLVDRVGSHGRKGLKRPSEREEQIVVFELYGQRPDYYQPSQHTLDLDACLVEAAMAEEAQEEP